MHAGTEGGGRRGRLLDLLWDWDWLNLYGIVVGLGLGDSKHGWVWIGKGGMGSSNKIIQPRITL
jgi:hypothetical protein